MNIDRLKSNEVDRLVLVDAQHRQLFETLDKSGTELS